MDEQIILCIALHTLYIHVAVSIAVAGLIMC